MGKIRILSPEAIEKRRTYGQPRKLLGKRKKCLFCDVLLRYDNKILTCRKHRTKSPIYKKEIHNRYYKNIEKNKKRALEYNNRPDIKEKKRIYDHNRVALLRDKRRPYYKEYVTKRRHEDFLYKLKGTLRYRIWHALTTHYTKNKKTIELLGADIITVKNHLEEQFTEGMTWNNHGKWHIDHIIPLTNAKSQEEMEKLCHYTNLQPLWKSDNLKKGKRIFFK